MQSFSIERRFICWALKTFEINRIPVWSWWWAHWSSSSFLTLLRLAVVIFIWGALWSNWFWDALLRKLIEALLISTYTTCFFNFIVERFIIPTLITAIGLIVPERSLRRTKWMSVITLHNTFLGRLIKIVTLSTILLRRLALSCLFVPFLIFVTFSTFSQSWVKIRSLYRTWLTRITQRIPKWSVWWTWALICISWLL